MATKAMQSMPWSLPVLTSFLSPLPASVSVLCFNRIPQTRHLNNRHLFSHSCGGCKSNIKLSVGLVLLRPLSLTRKWRLLPVFLHGCLFVRVHVCVQMSSSYKDTSSYKVVLDQGPPSAPHFNLTTCLETLSPSTVTF